jgi:hypothetical protein
VAVAEVFRVSVFYKPRHRSEGVRDALTAFLEVLVLVSSVLVAVLVAVAVLVVSATIGLVAWQVNPLWSFLWVLSLTLAVPTIILGRWYPT